MERKLRGVQTLEAPEAQQVLDLPEVEPGEEID